MLSFLDGVDTALTDAEKEGLATFMKVNCTMCHNGRVVGGGMFQKLGLAIDYQTEDVDLVYEMNVASARIARARLYPLVCRPSEARPINTSPSRNASAKCVGCAQLIVK